jgi:hypothetical protein
MAHGHSRNYTTLTDATGDQVWLKLPGMDALSARVAWELDLMIGCKFDVPLHPAVFAKIVNRAR